MAGSGPSSNHTDLIAGSPAVITRGGGYIRTPRDAVMVKDHSPVASSPEQFIRSLDLAALQASHGLILQGRHTAGGFPVSSLEPRGSSSVERINCGDPPKIGEI